MKRLLEIECRYNKADATEIEKHLADIDSSYAIRLSERVNIKEYAIKLFTYSERIEMWSHCQLVGLVAFYYNDKEKEVYISNVSINKEYRNRGVAKRLMAQLERLAVKNQYKRIRLESSIQVSGFYKKIGFQVREKISTTICEMVKFLS